MPRFRCDFEVKSDLAIPYEKKEIGSQTSSGHEIIIRNDMPDSYGNIPGLVCSIIGEADDIEGAHKVFRDLLTNYLDTLTFVTQSSFYVEKILRLMEWEPGKRERQFKVFEKFPQNYPPEHGLVCDYLVTISELEQVEIPEFVRVALKYFRYGFLERSPADQFMRFWLALEVIAENTKPTTKIAKLCTGCGRTLKCEHCGCETQSRPMATEAIRAIISKITGNMGQEISKRQLAARNSIMHGRKTEDLEKECKMPIGKILNELVAVTHRAIFDVLPLTQEGSLLFFGYRDDVAKKELILAMVGEFQHNGSSLHPQESDLPNVQISVTDAIKSSF